MKINEVASIILLSFVVGYFSLFLTGCAGGQIMFGYQAYNKNHEIRAYQETEEMRNVGGKNIGAVY